MISAPARDPLADRLLTRRTQRYCTSTTSPRRWPGVHSMDRDLLVKNAVSILKTIKTFQVPVMHTTVNVAPAAESQPSPN
jgi:hypothetical protein